MGGVGRAFGKLMLFGEHAAVYGYPAVGASLPVSLTARLSGKSAPEWDLLQVTAEDRGPVRGVLARLEETVPGFTAAGRCSLMVESTVPRGAGFGSSAALCGALALAAMEHAGIAHTGTERREAWRHAHAAERLFHGTPSGVDTGLSLIGGLLAFRPMPPALPEMEELPPAGLWLVTAAVPRDEACGALIAGLGTRMNAGETEVRDAMETLGSIAQRAWDALKAAGQETRIPGVIGSLADEAMETLRTLGLSTPALDELIRQGKAGGSIGGKLSGAGGGGAFYLVAADEAGARAVADAVTSAAARHGFALTDPARVLALPGAPRPA
jgi:mevalonate kinase